MNDIKTYTKEQLEEALQHFSFYEIVQVGDIVTNRNALVLRDPVIAKGTDVRYDSHRKKIVHEAYFICEKSGKWTGTSKGWTLEAKPLEKKDSE